MGLPPEMSLPVTQVRILSLTLYFLPCMPYSITNINSLRLSHIENIRLDREVGCHLR